VSRLICQQALSKALQQYRYQYICIMIKAKAVFIFEYFFFEEEDRLVITVFTIGAWRKSAKTQKKNEKNEK
jgi:hypothetical protein